jgi:iron complex transport system substrate-binding protein
VTRTPPAALRAAALAALLAPAAAAAGQVRATDFRGKEIVLEAPARRVVCLLESALSGLYMLGAADRLVGIPRAALEPAVRPAYEALDPRIRAGSLPAPGSWDHVSLERVVALRPDLAIVWASQREAIAALEANGVPVFAVFVGSFADVERELLALGVLTDTEPRARELVALVRAELATVASRLAGLPSEARPRTWFAWAQDDLETSCRGSTVDDLLALAGARNACPLEAEHAKVGLERLLAWNPELLVMWWNPRRSPADLLADARLAPLAAVRARRVFELPSPFESDLWTAKYVNAVRRVAAWAHPDRFAGVDLDAEARSTNALLYGRDVSPGTRP